MIAELIELYEKLVEDGKAPRYGYSRENVPYGLEINDDGTIDQVIPFGSVEQNNQRRYSLDVPAHAVRTIKIQANFLCDNSSYMLGEDQDGISDKALKRFKAAAELHHDLLAEATDDDSQAVLAFFSRPPQAEAVKQEMDEAEWKKAMNSNFVLCRSLKPLTGAPYLQKIWEHAYTEGKEDGSEESECGKKPATNPEMLESSVSGELVVPELTHPNIKGMMGAQSSGAALVSFNAPAYSSYGKSQDLNAPMSKYEAFAYTTALNMLLKDNNYHRIVNKGSLTVVCWSQSAQPEYPQEMFYSIDGGGEMSQSDLMAVINAISQGKPADVNGRILNPDEHFYIMGLSPNAARIAVSFFMKDTFGNVINNVKKNYEDMAVTRPKFDRQEMLPIWMVLNQTVMNKPGKTIEAPAQMVSDLYQAILMGRPYPASLLNSTENRIRIEHDVTRAKAAIIKAYFTRKPSNQCPKEVLQMTVNDESTNVPYLLGRLFAVYEGLQHAANPGISTTIRDRYFTNASTMPALVFPQLGDLALKHQKKLGGGLGIYYAKQIAGIMSKLGTALPVRLSLPEQASFQLGYYFETQKRFSNSKKEMNNEEVQGGESNE